MKSETKSFRMFIVFTILTAFALSFVGFTELVSFFYPLIGYLGLFLIAVLIIVPVRLHKKKNGNAQMEDN
ncbi:MAG: hypothetical protein ACQEWU_20655 [Bacillota bacterium]